MTCLFIFGKSCLSSKIILIIFLTLNNNLGLLITIFFQIKSGSALPLEAENAVFCMLMEAGCYPTAVNPLALRLGSQIPSL